MTSVPYPFRSRMAKVQLKKLAEKGANDAPTLYLAGMQWHKWAEKYRFGDP